jgi:predicted esterase
MRSHLAIYRFGFRLLTPGLLLCVGWQLCALINTPRATAFDEPAAEQPATTTDAQPGDRKTRRPTKPDAGRADLAAAYLRLDRAFSLHPPSAERIAEFNQGFDRATLSFFSGKNADAVRAINQLTAELLPAADKSQQALAMSLRVRLEPPVWIVGSDSQALRAHVTSLYAIEAGDTANSKPRGFNLRFRPLSAEGVPGEAAATIAGELPQGSFDRFEQTLDLSPIAGSLPPATYSVEVVTPSGDWVQATRWSVVSGSLDAVREANVARLAEIKSDDPAILQALAACRSRNQLLSDSPSETSMAQFMSRPNALIGELDAEIKALAAGTDPYRRRAGDYWRTISDGDKTCPLRVFAPPAATGDEPVPLVIALHGAGADENMFFDAYGAGILKRLAAEHGCLVVTPTTNVFGGKPAWFDRLLEDLSHDYAIDRERVHVLGHSMGGGATSALCEARGDKIRAACCLAGTRGFSSKAKLPPILVIAARLDMVVPAAGIERGAQKAIAAGLPIEFREMKEYGHTLMVGTALSDAIPWLLSHK